MRYLLLAIAVMMAGCSASVTSVTIGVKDKESGKPLEGIRVERHCPVSTVEKILNPVGASYHPLRLADSRLTGKNGDVTFSESGPEDKYRIFSGSTKPLVIATLGREISVKIDRHFQSHPPETNQPAVTNWGYSVWLENGVLKYSAWSVTNW